MFPLPALICLFSCACAAFAAESVIVPGYLWKDTSGNVIQAHGAGMLKVGSTYYWYGEDKSLDSTLFKAVSCYESTDLVNWARQNDALSPVANTMISTSNVVERPKVLYNKLNSEYVMWFHSDTGNYGAAMVGVATAKTPCGPYTYKTSWQPLGAESRDEGIFQDANQTSYLLYASDNNQNFKITRLDANYYNVTTNVQTLDGVTLEAPGIVKRNSVYWLIASHTSGWAANPNKYFSSTYLSGTWSAQNDLAPANTNTASRYFSQNAYDLPLGTNAIYMGDRWRVDVLGSSQYIWYPLSWASGVPQIVHADVWSVDLAAGTYTVATGTSYEAESGTRSGSATIASSSAFSGGEAVGYLGNGGSVTIKNVAGNGAGQWVSLYYANGDSTFRNTTVSVNGGAAVVVQQPNTGGGSVLLSVPVKLTLANGATNSITVGAGQMNYAGDLDRIIVYTQG
ncbi:carbohydrate-binding module family 35 protein [Athelia psychrophila]|uniref:Carbohydrate-binding module family 35 protein n=1 Tax=Athelia psychrophila TaxID=1759441 RepID=A0A166BGX0_9AGAM|nr:carbohydrate-binding module family 35 protein [Fibularhizoctonia sp. CBS 109695]